MKCVTKDSVTSKVLAPGMYDIDVAPLLLRCRNNREVHLNYLKHLKESVATLREIVKEAQAVVQIVLWYLDSGCSKHMTGDHSRLWNFMKKFIRTVRFRNDHFGAITGYEDYVIGNNVISRVRIFHQKSVLRTPQQNGVVKRRDRTRMEAAQTMLIFSKALMFLWAEVVTTACYTQNRSLIHTPRILKNCNQQLVLVFFLVMHPVGRDRIYNKRTRRIMETFHVQFDELFEPMAFVQLEPRRVERPGSPATTIQVPVILAAGSTIIKDNPFATPNNDPFVNVFAPEPRSKASPSGDIISTRKQLATDALWCLYNSVLAKVKPKNFKSAVTEDCWFQAMQDEIHEFDRLQVWELVPRPDYVMIIALKWIYKVKLDEYDDLLKNKASKQEHDHLPDGCQDNIPKWRIKGRSLCGAGYLAHMYIANTRPGMLAVRCKAGCQDTRRSTSGSAQFFRDKLVSWSSKKQKSTAILTIEAEYITMSGCCAQILWMRHKGKEIAKLITPPFETASEEDSDAEQAQRDKDMQKNLAFIAKYFKKIYKPTNNNLKLQEQECGYDSTCILSGPYKPSTVLVHAVEAIDNSPAVAEHTTLETLVNMSSENKAYFLAEKEANHFILTGIGDDIYSTVEACQTTQEMWEAIERFYKLMNEMIENNLTVTTMQVNVQFLQQEWSRFVTIVKQQHKLDEVSYYKLFDILKQYQNEVNELRTEKLARNANPLALVANAQVSQEPFYQSSRSHRSQAPSPKRLISSRSHTYTRHKGKEIAKPITPLSETAFEEDSDPE
uniref:Retrovirus-related Pol polyprotein from transposon TNT 1-94-like beta-barrel domain-containing protein n=1 Tax=Tanacetum cinerariifolium TaxID=118510 RepID=A0A6L2K4P5_TANCI|nr:hypothetical protein [Tanacetum cinerariifolium]